MKEIFPKKILKILFTLERLIPKCESSLWFAWKGMATIWVNFYFLFCLQCFCNAFLVINKTLSVSSHKKDTELAFFLKSKQDSYHVFVHIGSKNRIKIFFKLIFLSVYSFWTLINSSTALALYLALSVNDMWFRLTIRKDLL